MTEKAKPHVVHLSRMIMQAGWNLGILIFRPRELVANGGQDTGDKDKNLSFFFFRVSLPRTVPRMLRVTQSEDKCSSQRGWRWGCQIVWMRFLADFFFCRLRRPWQKCGRLCGSKTFKSLLSFISPQDRLRLIWLKLGGNLLLLLLLGETVDMWDVFETHALGTYFFMESFDALRAWLIRFGWSGPDEGITGREMGVICGETIVSFLQTFFLN